MKKILLYSVILFTILAAGGCSRYYGWGHGHGNGHGYGHHHYDSAERYNR